MRKSEAGLTQKGVVARLLALVPSVPSAGCLLPGLRITPHVGQVRLVSVVPLMPVDVGLVAVLENIGFGILLDILVPGTLVSLAGVMVALKSVEGLVSEMSLVDPVFTSILILVNLRRRTSRFQSQKDLLVSCVGIILRLLLLLLLLGIKLNSTTRSMSVSVLVATVAVLIVLVTVQLSRPGEVGLVAGLRLTRVAL